MVSGQVEKDEFMQRIRLLAQENETLRSRLRKGAGDKKEKKSEHKPGVKFSDNSTTIKYPPEDDDDDGDDDDNDNNQPDPFTLFSRLMTNILHEATPLALARV